MYEFKDTTKQKCPTDIYIPSSAMYYNGVLLEELIQGYQTLSINGRETISTELTTDNLNVGSRISNSRLPSRIITVNFKFDAKNVFDMMNEQRKLMNFLYTEKDVEISFRDEPDIIYTGRFNTFNEIDGARKNYISSFTIFCESPLKFTLETFKTNGYVGVQTPYAYNPIKIKNTCVNSDQLKISNGVETIFLEKNAVKSQDVIEFDFLEGQVFINGINKTSLLPLNSDLENFLMRQGAIITTTNGMLEIEYKGVTL